MPLAFVRSDTGARRVDPGARMRFCPAVALLLLLLLSGTAFAADGDPASGTASAATVRLVLPTSASLTPAAADGAAPQPAPRTRDDDPRRTVLSGLHALTGVLQTYDGMLTVRVLKAGGTEANPLMKPAAGNQGVMLGIKIGAAVATVIGTERLWHDDHRTAAIVVSAIANGAMAVIARHNAGVLARLERR
jgi:hypothetical protein